ncbi:hypothetical protein EMMF5_002405 [Cystobasidiomycetes sp. EMM_F5]
MQAFARIEGSHATNSIIPGYSFSSGGFGYDNFLPSASSSGAVAGSSSHNGIDGSDANDENGNAGAVSYQQQIDPKIGRRAEVEDLYAVPENYLEIEGAQR